MRRLAENRQRVDHQVARVLLMVATCVWAIATTRYAAPSPA